MEPRLTAGAAQTKKQLAGPRTALHPSSRLTYAAKEHYKSARSIKLLAEPASPTPKKRPPAAPAVSPEQHPWDAPGLSRAERVIRFVNSLPCTAGPLAGTTLKLRPWQKQFIRAVYRTDKRGHRLVRTAVLSVSRKNGKTQLAAALCLCALSGPGAEARGECYAVACTRFQAGRVFNEMVAIITKTPWLNERINIVRFRKGLEDQVNGSTFDVLSADVAPVHGLSPSFVCYDELAQVPSRALYDALGTALGGRAQPLMLVISTQAARDDAPMACQHLHVAE